MPAANLHMTLAFLGSQPVARLDALRALGGGIHVPSFILELNQSGLIGDGHACLVPSTTPAALQQLVATINDGLQALGLQPEPRPFRPHVTLLRKAAALALPAPALSWPAARFGLYASHAEGPGVRYEELGSWPLQSNPPSAAQRRHR